jgi:hypothetical protein
MRETSATLPDATLATDFTAAHFGELLIAEG